MIGVIQLDMANYQGSSEDIVLITDYTDAGQNKFLTDLIDHYLGLRWALERCGYACSDHASWFEQGFVVSHPFEARMNDTNPAMHSANDTLAQSGGSVAHTLKFARMVVAYVVELAKGSINRSI